MTACRCCNDPDLLGVHLLTTSSSCSQLPPKRDETALQEEEELQLAIALSQSEAEEKERMVCALLGVMCWASPSCAVTDPGCVLVSQDTEQVTGPVELRG